MINKDEKKNNTKQNIQQLYITFQQTLVRYNTAFHSKIFPPEVNVRLKALNEWISVF